MVKKTITFESFDGETITKDFWFNMTKLELTELELRFQGKGTMVEYLQKIVDAADNREIYDTFKDIIRKAVGVKSEDGMRFIKNDEYRSELMDSNAVGELFLGFMEEGADENALANFFNQIIPKELSEKAAENAANKENHPAISNQ